MLSSRPPAGDPVSGRSRALGVAMAVIWLAGPAIAAYAVYVDDWRPMVAIVPLLVVDHLVFGKWIDSDPGLSESQADELLTEDDEEKLSDLPDKGGALDYAIFFLDNPELITRLRYGFRGALVVRTAATVTMAVGWLLFVAALPSRPLLGALGALLVVVAGGSAAHQLTLALAPRFRARATAEDRQRFLRRDKIVENAGWTVLAALIGYKLIEGA